MTTIIVTSFDVRMKTMIVVTQSCGVQRPHKKGALLVDKSIAYGDFPPHS